MVDLDPIVDQTGEDIGAGFADQLSVSALGEEEESEDEVSPSESRATRGDAGARGRAGCP